MHGAIYSQPLQAAQAAREQGEIEAAATAAVAARRRLVAQGRESCTEYGREAFALHGEAVRVGLDALLTRFCRNPGIAGPHYQALPLLLHWADKGLAPLALVALGAVVDSMTRRRSYSQLAAEIGRRVEAEVLAMRVEERGSDLLRLLKRQAAGRTGEIIGARRLRELGINPERWTAADRKETGGLLLDLVEAETDLITVTRGSRPMVEPTAEGMALARANPPRPLPPRRLPMLAPPRPWAGLRGGGHFTNQAPLVRSRQPIDLSYLARADLSPVLQVVNTLQAQQMAVDPWMAEVQRQAWDAGIPGLYPLLREPEKPPPRPDDDRDRRAWAEWYQASARCWADSRNGNGKRVRIEQALRQLEQVAGRPVWFAYDLDHRGRIYSSNRYATHQGPDWEKGAVGFARGKPCDELAVEQILMAAAGHYGLSRAPWGERLRWGRANVDRLRAAAAEPLDRIGAWRDAKDPWQFLQMARAFSQWIDDPSQPIGAPVRFDQTTSGPAILSALLRHEGVALECNLIGSEPRDIYARVGRRLEQLLRVELEAGDPAQQELAAFWLERGIDRQLTKSPVMTMTYGARYPSLVDHLVDQLMAAGGNEARDYQRLVLRPARFMAKRVMEVLKQEVAPCLAAEAWLRRVAAVVVKQQRPIEWTSPMGLPIRVAALAPRRSTVSTLLQGSAKWQTLMDEPEPGELSALATTRSITANLVHSFDAAFAQAMVCRCAAQGVEVLTNHDAFATCPADAGWLHGALHQQLRELYAGDHLGRIAAEIKARTGVEAVPGPPPAGGLDPERIGENPYAFS